MKQDARQTSLSGTAPDIGGLLRLKSAAAMKPSKPQKACDMGLFGDDAEQLDLITTTKGQS